MLLTVQALAVGRLRLYRARRLLARGRGSGLRARRTLEDGWVLDEGLWHGVTGVVRRTVVLVLGVRIVVREWRRVTLLRALATGLALVSRLTGLRELLRWLSTGRRQTGSAMGLLRCAREALDVFVTEHVAVTEASWSRVGVVEVL